MQYDTTGNSQCMINALLHTDISQTVFDQCSMTLQIYHRQCWYEITDISLTVGVQCSMTLEIYHTQCLINAVYYSV